MNEQAQITDQAVIGAPLVAKPLRYESHQRIQHSDYSFRSGPQNPHRSSFTPFLPRFQ